MMGIDLGSSFFKVEVFDDALRCIGSASAPVVYSEDNGRVEISVADCELALHDAILGAIQASGCKPVDITAIAFASQAQTFTIRTPEGKAARPFISWRDNRDVPGNPANALKDFDAHCSVCECQPALTVSKLAGMQGAVKDDDLVLWLPSWFVLQITGRAAVDVNLAAMSGLYSLQDGDWWPDALTLCNITPRNLPELSALGAVAGLTTEAADRYGLPPGIPVVLAGNDQTAGAYSAGIHAQGSLLISLGTAQVAYISLPELPQPLPGTMRGPYPGGRYYRLAADDFGAGTLNWARKILPGCASEKDFDRAAASAPAGCRGVRFIADGPSGTGHWIGVEGTLATTADKARAVIETLVERMLAMVEKLTPVPGQRNVILCGGGARSEPWRDCLAQRLGVPLICKEDVAPSIGAARMAAEITKKH